ncbi:mitochondrial ribosomal protein L23 [Phyllostomus discolor]|uniref:Mitochondrial ribosomal protein L23 n=1 Tax=Phyllostomus discolor TaxID=89673 RepID=A0A834E5W3_9CHIR|nr:mitochondrial ribosomal protein L23 [Phyllostomus discolor]
MGPRGRPSSTVRLPAPTSHQDLPLGSQPAHPGGFRGELGVGDLRASCPRSRPTSAGTRESVGDPCRQWARPRWGPLRSWDGHVPVGRSRGAHAVSAPHHRPVRGLGSTLSVASGRFSNGSPAPFRRPASGPPAHVAPRWGRGQGVTAHAGQNHESEWRRGLWGGALPRCGLSPPQVPALPAGRPPAPRVPHQLLHPAGATRRGPARGHRAVPDPHGDDQGGPAELPGAHLRCARGRRADQGAARSRQEEGPQERAGEDARLQGGLRAAGSRTDLHVPRPLPREDAGRGGQRPGGAAGGAAEEAEQRPPARGRPWLVRPVTG